MRKLVASTSVTPAAASANVDVVAAGTVFTVDPADVAGTVDAGPTVATVNPSVVAGAGSVVVVVMTALTPANIDEITVPATSTDPPNTDSRHRDIVPPKGVKKERL